MSKAKDQDTENIKELTALTKTLMGLQERPAMRDQMEVLMCLQHMARTLDRIENELKLLRKGK